MSSIEGYQVGVSYVDKYRKNFHAIPVEDVEGLNEEQTQLHALGVLEAMRVAISIVPTSGRINMLLADDSLLPEQTKHELTTFGDEFDPISNPAPKLGEGVLHAVRVDTSN